MSKSFHKVCFLLNLSVPEVYVSRPAKSRLEFAVPEHLERNLVIVLYNREGGDRGPWGEDVVCRVTASYDVDKSVSDFVEAFVGGKVIELASGLSLPHLRSGHLIAREDGTIVKGEAIRVQELPLAVQKLLNTAQADMLGAAFRFLQLLRWQQGAVFRPDIIEQFTLGWNVCGPNFHTAPFHDLPPITLGMRKGLCWETEDRVAFEALWSCPGQSEPAPHRLYRLAASLREDRPEAASLILAAALESAAKQHVGHFDPERPWIRDETAWSPSFKQLIERVIPKIYADKGVDEPNLTRIKPWLDDILKFIEHRHSIAHGRAQVELAHGLGHYFSRALDFIYLLNVIEGHVWARRMLSPELCRLLGWPQPPAGFGSVRMKML